jgi:hypothetical protein
MEETYRWQQGNIPLEGKSIILKIKIKKEILHSEAILKGEKL